jgi:hypothetical protein
MASISCVVSSQVAGLAEQVLSVLGQGERAGGLVKKPHPEMVLELADEAGGGRVAGAGLAGNGGE